MELVQCFIQRQELIEEQKIQLSQLLQIQQQLKHPDIPHTTKGLRGMQIAHRILQQRKAVGVLIGGLSEKVWNQRRKPQDLASHKDVDVAVLDSSFQLKKDFEGGIDWWLPQATTVTVSTDAGIMEGVPVQWHQNGNGVVLSFGMEQENNVLDPGLHIPDAEWVLDMRVCETEAHIDYRAMGEIDDAVFEEFRERMRRRVKTCLPKFLREAFQGFILSDRYESNSQKVGAVTLKPLDLERLAAIYKHIGR